MASIPAAAPQFLVDRLDDAMAFYEQRLGFERDAAAASSPRGSRVSGSSRGSSPLGSDCGFGLEHFRLFSGCWRWPMLALDESGDHRTATALASLASDFEGRRTLTSPACRPAT
jgi:hypothetical protein